MRYGCHCAHLLIKRLVGISPLLERLQGLIVTLLPQVNLPGVVRVSLGIENSEADVDMLIDVLGSIARQPRGGMGKNVQRQVDAFTRAAARRVYDPQS